MSEAYQQKEWELNNLIDNLNSIEYTYEEYKKEIEHFIDRLLEDTKEINVLRNQLQQKENIIKEVREYIENNSLYEQDYDYDYEENLYEYPPSDEQARKDILSILDKENNNE